ncbi:MAG: hypothetical protein Q4A58_07700 [Fusobacterium sp.]|uniref:hypothetical protein n=1 Tax=Fusobacterium sp. TaxID=68766 RepID=UPI0026DB2C30|nr:hypothetical protein [Fusobacterium sp.]MDO4691161.1 hypothetical protein [Fusobacterium sp.]
MKYLNLYINLMILNINYILFIYFIFVVTQLICLYYEYHIKNLVLFLGNKAILICSILIAYIFKDNTLILLIYFIGLVILKDLIDKKYGEKYSKEIADFLLEDIFFLIISGLLSFYLI